MVILRDTNPCPDPQPPPGTPIAAPQPHSTLQRPPPPPQAPTHIEVNPLPLGDLGGGQLGHDRPGGGPGGQRVGGQGGGSGAASLPLTLADPPPSAHRGRGRSSSGGEKMGGSGGGWWLRKVGGVPRGGGTGGSYLAPPVVWGPLMLQGREQRVRVCGSPHNPPPPRGPQHLGGPHGLGGGGLRGIPCTHHPPLPPLPAPPLWEMGGDTGSVAPQPPC